MVNVISSSRYKIERKHIRQLAQELLLKHGFGGEHELNIVFAGKTKLKELSKKYKQENEALPVLTFVYNEPVNGKRLLGEVLICYPQAVLMAAQKNKTVNKIVDQLVVHGLQNIFDNI